jgi:hypothetical protein
MTAGANVGRNQVDHSLVAGVKKKQHFKVCKDTYNKFGLDQNTFKVRLHNRAKSMLDEIAWRVFDNLRPAKRQYRPFCWTSLLDSSLKPGTLLDSVNAPLGSKCSAHIISARTFWFKAIHWLLRLWDVNVWRFFTFYAGYKKGGAEEFGTGLPDMMQAINFNTLCILFAPELWLILPKNTSERKDQLLIFSLSYFERVPTLMGYGG